MVWAFGDRRRLRARAHAGPAGRPRGGVRLLRRPAQPGSDHAALAALPHRPGAGAARAWIARRLPPAPLRLAASLARGDRRVAAAAQLPGRPAGRPLPAVGARAPPSPGRRRDGDLRPRALPPAGGAARAARAAALRRALARRDLRLPRRAAGRDLRLLKFNPGYVIVATKLRGDRRTG